jgi:hypothetical protein
MLKPTLLALAITSALLTACGGGGGTTPTIPPVATVPPVTTPPVTAPPVTTPPVTTPPVTTPPVTAPPVTTVNPPFAFDQHEVTVKAGTNVILSGNIYVHSFTTFTPGTGLTIAKPMLSTGVLDYNRVQITAAANAPTYDIYVIGSGLRNSADVLAGDTYDWVKVHVVGSAPAPWIHLDALSAPTDPVETEFLKALNAARATGGTCTDPSTGIVHTYPPVPPVTLNVQASGGLRMKVEDALQRGWLGVHESPEGMGFTDFINMAGMSGFINEILFTGTNTRTDPAQAALYILNTFLGSYYHCAIIYSSSVDAGGQVAMGFYRSSANNTEFAASFTDKPSANMSPLLKLN